VIFLKPSGWSASLDKRTAPPTTKQQPTMKKNLALFALAAAALLAAPALTRAQDAAANSPATPAPAPKKHHGLMFHGKIAAVDTTAMTVTIGTKTYNITSGTKISKDGKPATLADFAVGDMVGGAYKMDGDKLDATVLRSGGKKKKAE
jgi:hypothetical protein